MKLVTRYLLGHMRRPWIYVMVGFSLVAVLVDLFDNFSSFMDAGTPIRHVLLYYAVLLPTYLPYLLPISMLLALLYGLWQLGKNSEIVAMRACGFSLTQLIMPYLLTGVLASLALLAVNELFNPWATHWTRQFKSAQNASSKGAPARFSENLAYKNVVGRRLWRVDSFDPRPAASHQMRGIKLTQQRPDGSDEYVLTANRARWLDGHWWFEDVETLYYNARGDRVGPVESSPSREMVELSETPRDFINEIKDSSERSAADILQFISTHKGISAEARNRMLVDFHYRLAAPWLCIIVVLVGVPFGMHTGRRGMGIGILLALLVFFGYYVLMGFGLAFGKQGLAPPLLAGWLPGALFFFLGVSLLRRSR